MPTSRSARALRTIEALQARVQRDEGGRGIAALLRPNMLLAAAEALVAPPPNPAQSGVLLLTGFPCLRERTPPVESDGPPGAVALAFTLLALGRAPVTMLIEDHSVGVLESCAAASGVSAAAIAAFPTADRWSSADDARLDALHAGACGIVSIERAGEAADGTCYTMRGLPMGASLLGPLNAVARPGRGAITVGIGDGGNELGMGSLHDDIARTVKLGDKIGCVVPADAPLVASVSNWGGYALSCAVAVLEWDAGRRGDGSVSIAPSADADTPAARHLRRLVHDRDMARSALLACSAAGAVDGITAAGDGSCDGMPLETHLELLDELRAITLEGLQSGGAGGMGESE